MKHVRVAEARARFGELLDAAEQGNPVVVERRGIRFRIVAETSKQPPPEAPMFDFVDREVLSGSWTWESGPRGLKFSSRKRR